MRSCFVKTIKTLSQRTACRRRDRDNRRRSLVVWESVLQPHWHYFGFGHIVASPRLMGWWRRSRSSSHNVSVAGCGSDSGRNIVAATAIGPVSSPVVEFFAVAESLLLLLGNDFSCKICFLFVAGLGSFLAQQRWRQPFPWTWRRSRGNQG